MTAEIAVFNSSAIALAADSAVTINGNNLVKINNNADKLFELSKHHPIGVMIFNNASLSGAPWELLIKSYRKKLSSKSKDTIYDYSADFIEHIEKDNLLISDKMRLRSSREIYVQHLVGITQEINQKDIVQLIQKKGVNINSSDFHSLLLIKIKSEIKKLKNAPYFPGIEKSCFKEAIAYVEDYVRETTTHIIPNEPGVNISDSLWNVLIEYAALLICRQHESKYYTGIVFAGYGENDYYPSIRTIHVFGLFKDKLLYIEDTDKTKKSDPFQAAICPFAQEDEVVTFMEGCSKNVNDFTDILAKEITDRVENFVTEYLNGKLTSSDMDEFKQFYDSKKITIISDFFNKKRSFITENHIKKTLSMLNSLGKVDLAYMAGSMVDLTAFKRRISNDHETVGGPVDVAVISKGDGFVWIKRKHYFPSDINHNFFERRKTTINEDKV